MKNLKNIIILLWLLLLYSCESVVSYQGVVLNIYRHPIEEATILVNIEGEIREDYGIQIPDTIHYLKRDSINAFYGVKMKSYLINEKEMYILFKPHKTDSMGYFELNLNESNIFSQPSYKIIFKKEGYKDYELIGDWNSKDNLEIIMKKI